MLGPANIERSAAIHSGESEESSINVQTFLWNNLPGRMLIRKMFPSHPASTSSNQNHSNMSSIGAEVLRSKGLTALASTRQAKRVISSDERKQQENGTKEQECGESKTRTHRRYIG